jgi:hypothetical protein
MIFKTSCAIVFSLFFFNVHPLFSQAFVGAGVSVNGIQERGGSGIQRDGAQYYPLLQIGYFKPITRDSLFGIGFELNPMNLKGYRQKAGNEHFRTFLVMSSFTGTIYTRPLQFLRVEAGLSADALYTARMLRYGEWMKSKKNFTKFQLNACVGLEFFPNKPISVKLSYLAGITPLITYSAVGASGDLLPKKHVYGQALQFSLHINVSNLINRN